MSTGMNAWISAAAEALSVSAERGDNDLVARAREWAGTNVTRRIWVCDIARNAKRVDALAILARCALDACRGDGVTYGRLSFPRLHGGRGFGKLPTKKA